MLFLMMETISIYYDKKLFTVSITYIKTRLSIFPLPKNHSSYISVPKFDEEVIALSKGAWTCNTSIRILLQKREEDAPLAAQVSFRQMK